MMRLGYCDNCQERRLLHFSHSHHGDTSQCGRCRGLTLAESLDEIVEDSDPNEGPHHSVDAIAVAAGAL